MFLQSTFSKLLSCTFTANKAAGSFLPERACVSLPLLFNPVCAGGPWHLQEGSLRASGVEELWGWVQCFQPDQHLGAPCFCLRTVVNVFLLSLSGARALFGLSASISASPTRGCAVCQSPGGEGAHPHLLMGLFPGCLVLSLPATECW